MRKAFIEQIFLSFLLIVASMAFVATVNDETSTRNYIDDLKALGKTAAKAMSKDYQRNIDLCTAQNIANDIIVESDLGTDLTTKGLISYQWLDLKPDANADGVGDDGEPDTVKVTIARHKHNTFWYRFFGFDDFDVGPFEWIESIDVPVNVSINYGGTNAGFNNMIGTYQLDPNGCVINPQLILNNAQGTTIGTQLGNPIQSPPTFIFIVPNGYNDFSYPSLSSAVTISNGGQLHCPGDPVPSTTINGVTRSPGRGIFFEQLELNGDGFNHIHIIPNTIWTTYNTYLNQGGGRNYNTFMALCSVVNFDNDPNNNIPAINYIEGVNDCENDINGEYQYAMEDLLGGGDQDFNDIMLDTTRTVVPNSCNCYTVEPDGSLDLTCLDNNPPIVNLTGCPLTVNENTSTSAINWSDNDTDGTVVDRQIFANNGTALLNMDGTITYTPLANFSGIDTVTLRVRDNEGSSGTDTCTINVLDTNEPPVINGIPQIEVLAGSLYQYFANATDPDGDTITYIINNKPPWANFDVNTGVLSGTPSVADIGLYANVVVMANDGNGGTDTITFNINVLEDSENSPPVLVNPIPDQTVQETKAFSYNVSPHFTDPDGDELSFSATYFFNGNYYPATVSPEGVVSTPEIPMGYVGQTIIVTVIANDGVYNASDVFNVTITNQEDLAVFNDTFDTDEQNWTSTNDNIAWIKDLDDSNEGKLKIFANTNGTAFWAAKSYNFGPVYANRNISISFDMDFLGVWEKYPESGYDSFMIAINGEIKQTYTDIGDSTTEYLERSFTLTGKTDGDGRISLHLGLRISSTAEFMQVDNVHLELGM